jgi:hypothetical protein
MFRRSTAAALAVLLVAASSVLGATAQQASSETLVVSTTTTLTGLPATLSYGSVLGGATASTSPFTLNAATNNANGLNVAYTASDFASGGNTIAATARSMLFTSAGSGCSSVGALSTWNVPPGKAHSGAAGTSQPMVTRPNPGSCAIAGVTMSVAVPGGAIPGTYAGTLTVTVTEIP